MIDKDLTCIENVCIGNPSKEISLRSIAISLKRIADNLDADRITERLDDGTDTSTRTYIKR